MNANSGSPAGPSIIGYILRLVLVGISIYFIYFAYNKLYEGPASSTVLLKDIHVGNPEVGKAFTFEKKVIPPLFEGGEYTVSAWVYVNGWANSNRYQFNKEILRIGNPAGNLTLGIYLDYKDNKLHVITGTMPSPSAPGSNDVSGGLTSATYDTLFTNAMPTMQSIGHDCEVSPFALQRWVLVNVALSGKTVDVYIDGKLARSCILPDLFRVDSEYNIIAGKNGGFSGFISGLKADAYALNPEEIYRMYMAGPLGAVGYLEYFKSLFDPKAIGTLDYPKMNL